MNDNHPNELDEGLAKEANAPIYPAKEVAALSLYDKNSDGQIGAPVVTQAQIDAEFEQMVRRIPKEGRDRVIREFLFENPNLAIEVKIRFAKNVRGSRVFSIFTLGNTLKDVIDDSGIGSINEIQEIVEAVHAAKTVYLQPTYWFTNLYSSTRKIRSDNTQQLVTPATNIIPMGAHTPVVFNQDTHKYVQDRTRFIDQIKDTMWAFNCTTSKIYIACSLRFRNKAGCAGKLRRFGHILQLSEDAVPAMIPQNGPSKPMVWIMEPRYAVPPFRAESILGPAEADGSQQEWVEVVTMKHNQRPRMITQLAFTPVVGFTTEGLGGLLASFRAAIPHLEEITLLCTINSKGDVY